MEKKKEIRKPLYKKWWFWVIVILWVGRGINSDTRGKGQEEADEPENSAVQSSEPSEAPDDESDDFSLEDFLLGEDGGYTGDDINGESMIDSFVDSYNESAAVPISDLFEIDINDREGGFYRTEFRLIAYKDAPAKHGTIGDSSVELINYGAISRDSFRIHIKASSLEEMKEIFENSVHVFYEDITSEQFQQVYDGHRDGVSVLEEKGIKLLAYGEKDSIYKLEVDFGTVENIKEN